MRSRNHQLPRRSTAVLRSCLLLMAASVPSSAKADRPHGLDAAGALDAVTLDERELNESSGLASSLRRPGRFWTHNDSGGEPLLYAFDASGRSTGQCRLRAVTARDWEDMASFIDEGTPRLLVADCGDNDSQRRSIALFLLDEPDPDRTTEQTPAVQLDVRFEDGPRDCEAVAVDSATQEIILIAKSRSVAAGVYTLPLPSRRERTDRKWRQQTAKRVGTLPLPMITAMDVDPNRGDVWVVNYFHAFCFSCRNRSESLALRIGRSPRAFELPRWKQIEAAGLDASSNLWVTSEGRPALLGRVATTNPLE